MLGHQRLDEERALLRIEAGADPVGDVVVGVRRRARWCRRSRSSARASRRRSRSSRTASCSGTQLLSAPTRWPRCSWPVGRMPETTRALGVTVSHGSQDRMNRYGGSTMTSKPPERHQRVEQHEPVRPQLVRTAPPALAAAARASTLPPSSGGIGIRLKTASSTFRLTQPVRNVATGTDTFGSPSASGDTGTHGQQRSPRPPPAIRLLTGPAAATSTKSRRGWRRLPERHRHRLRPADQRQRRSPSRSAGTAPCRSDRRARAGSARRGRAAAPSDRPADRPSTRAPPRAPSAKTGER